MTDELTPLTSWAQANRETIYPEGFGEGQMTDYTDWSDAGCKPMQIVALPVAIGYRQGARFIAEFDAPVDELKVRRGRLTARVGGIWHIVPTGDALEGKK